MSRHTTKMKENKMTQLLLLSMLGFAIVISLLDALSLEPSLTDVQFYLLFFVVFALIYRPFGLFVLRSIGKVLRFIKYLFVKKSSRVYDIDQLSGKDFEQFLKPLFEKQGFTTEMTKASGDYEADIILRKGKQKFVVQAKRRNGKVGVKAVQEVVAAINYYKANGAIVVTNQYFTSSAKNLAKSNDVKLIDRDELTKLLNGSNKKYRLATAISLLLNK